MDRFNKGRRGPVSRVTAKLLVLTCLAAFLPGPASATEEKAPSAKAPAEEADLPPLTARQLGEPMSIARLDALIRRAGEDVQRQGTRWVFKVADRQIQVVSDPRADRMRILVPVRDVSGLDARELYRLLQASFETALDARYAIAGEMVWSVFIHPLRTLDDTEFLSGLGQTINLAKTYGKEYTSGFLSYGGGDAAARKRRQLIDELLKSGDAI
ncbi:MAG: hypothetical protein AAGL24_13395 [Pseudomonadota bacterium]